MSNVATHLSQLSIPLDTYTVVAPHLISKYERVYYWNGISPDPPELLYRLDLDLNPFLVPVPGERWSELPVKTTEGVFGMPLNAVWDIIALMIVSLLKKRIIKYSAINTAHFSTREGEGKKTLGPIVIWITTHPNTTSAKNAHDASPEILEEHNVHGAVVEWYEGSVEKLSGPVLLCIADKTNPTHYVHWAFTAALGMPIATKERKKAGVQGTVSFFFHEGRDKNGKPSARVFAVSNKHILCVDTTMNYQFKGNGAPCQLV